MIFLRIVSHPPCGRIHKVYKAGAPSSLLHFPRVTVQLFIDGRGLARASSSTCSGFHQTTSGGGGGGGRGFGVQLHGCFAAKYEDISGRVALVDFSTTSSGQHDGKLPRLPTCPSHLCHDRHIQTCLSHFLSELLYCLTDRRPFGPQFFQFCG